jgi:electron transport complex protein RnfA
MGVSSKSEAAASLGIATIFVITLSSVCTWIINNLILIPLNLVYLRTLSYILVISFVVQFTEVFVRGVSPSLYRLLGIFLPLITTNCIVLGVPLLSVNLDYSFFQSVIYGFGASLGFCMVIVVFSGIRERISIADIPTPFKGEPIALITAGLMALGFIGFTGLVNY